MTEFKPETLIDGFSECSQGMNRDLMPLLLPKNQLSLGMNLTVRGTYIRPRPPKRKLLLTFSADIQNAFESGLFQAAIYYKPDFGLENLLASISGRLYKVTPSATTATVEDVTGGDPQTATQYQMWMWQTEKWVIWNDGVKPPLIFDGTTCTRSTYVAPTPFNTTTATDFNIPAIGSSASVDFAAVANLHVGDIVTLPVGSFKVLTIVGVTVTLLNLNAGPEGLTIATGTTVDWVYSATMNKLPPGRMGAYGLGRNWICLVDGKQFVATDLVGGSSGTASNNYRDAVLSIRENNYLAGGGYFTVPGSIGTITAMRFMANLDKSLGQGSLQIFTHSTVFSCNAPVDRLEWQDLQNPILTESLIGNGALSQDATLNVNSDMLFRSLEGVRSYILGRRDFVTWGNTPQSREVEPLLARDSPDLLSYSSAVVFDNRYLLTVNPVLHDQGVYFRGFIALNFDPVSSLRGKAPSVYDGLWTGLNVLKLVVGEFSGIVRCFAFGLNIATKKIELYELLPSATDIYTDYDGAEKPIVREFETSAMFNYSDKDARAHMLKRLTDGEVSLDQVRGNVYVQAWYKPDSYPCYEPWHQFNICSQNSDVNDKPDYRTRLGLGEPSPKPCEVGNNRPLREGFWFQMKFVITGQCRFLGARFKSVTIPQTQFAKPSCEPLCEH